MALPSIEQLEARFTNLADADAGAEALFASDDFFADKSRMLASSEPEWREGVYDEHGKWMDGWESRRKREHGFDFCIIRLVDSGVIHALNIDTQYFTGTYPPVASLLAARLDSAPDEDTQWTEILSPQPIVGDSHNIFQVDSDEVFNFLKLNIFPDGGVARLRVFGEKKS